MPFSEKLPTEPCPVCGTAANFPKETLGDLGIGQVVHCFRCGDFVIAYNSDLNAGPPLAEKKTQALASHLIRKQGTHGKYVVLNTEFFEGLSNTKLPSPAEAADNLLLIFGDWAGASPGTAFHFGDGQNPPLMAIVGVVEWFDLQWLGQTLATQNLIGHRLTARGNTYITYLGWQRIEDLKKARVASEFAFFARRFENPELDDLFEKCLRPAVEQTGYELRTVTQRAGLIDAVVEDEIRRCKFLIADLSDANAGAYWEAGFAEGLGKPVIYVCRAEVADVELKTHFDTDHRQTVRWGEPHSLDETSQKLKAVIRNTLLGDAKQDD